LGRIVYVDRSDIREGRLEELTAAIESLASFIEQHNPRILDYRIFIDAEAGRMMVVAVHPDAEAMELHLEVGKEEFRKVGDLIELRSIDVFGRPSETVMQQLREKAAMLGEHGTVNVYEPSAGFTRLGG
jgi:hypothetical protein